MRPRRILLIFDDCGPGDAVASAFVLDAVRAAHPSAGIVVLAGQNVAEIFERSEVPDLVVVSRLYTSFPRGRIRASLEKIAETMRLVWRLGRGFDLALTFFWGTFALNLTAFLVARRRIGYVNRWSFLQSSTLGKYDPSGQSVSQNLEVIVAAAIEPPRPSIGQLPRKPIDTGVVEAIISRGETNRDRPLAVLHAGSDWACQQWSPESWAALADALIDEYGLSVLWTGSEDERGYIGTVQSHMRHSSISVCGQTTSLASLSELLARAALCISVDSVPWELAVGEGTPTIVLTGPRLPSRRLTDGNNVLVINRTRPDVRGLIVRCQAGITHGVCHDYSCPLSQLRHIRVAEVMKKVEAIGTFSRPDLQMTAQ